MNALSALEARSGRSTATSRRFTGGSPRSRTAPSPPTSRSSPRSIPTSSASPSRPSTARSTPPATPTLPSPSSRSRRPSSTATRSPNTAARTCCRVIGVEPTGEAFNSIVLDEVAQPAVQPDGQCRRDGGGRADQGRQRPRPGSPPCSTVLSRYAGRSLIIDDDVFRSEQATGHRNRAIAYMMLNSGMIHSRARDHPRHLFPPMLGAGDLRRPRGDGGDARQ